MNTLMWEHPLTKTQLKTLKKWGYQIIKPISKVLACGDDGMGAMAEPVAINTITKKSFT
jgi:phosphopantothenoylcysteine decarboxylase